MFSLCYDDEDNDEDEDDDSSIGVHSNLSPIRAHTFATGTMKTPYDTSHR